MLYEVITDAMVETKNRLIDHGQQNPVGNEPGVIIGFSRDLAEFLRQIPGPFKGLFGGGNALDDLHKRNNFV